ncbi:MAG: hypothetical protein IJ315_08535 [Firmicutes bacterium]|nr:hypothetical protein [Bacillota bacterium]
MLNQEHWPEIKERMMGYWNREAMDRCTFSISVKKPGYYGLGGGYEYFEADEIHRKNLIRFGNHLYFGDAFPCHFSYFGTAGIAEYTGCKATRLPHTTWFDPWLDEPDADQIHYSCPEAFEAQKAAIARMAELAKDDYMVSVTDNCGVLDALAAIRGTEDLMMDMITDPEFVEEGVQKLLDIYKQTQTELFDLLKENNDGSVHSWMQLWAPQKLAQMQCDCSVMLSPEMFNRFAMPELEELTAFLDYPVYHLDGQEQIRHLDSLLSLKNLRAIQWTPVSGQPFTSEFIPVLQRIQKAGKNLVLVPKPWEVEKLLDNLSSRGLHLMLGEYPTQEAALEMIDLIEKHSKDRG